MTANPTRSKHYGYEIEVQALKALRSIWPDMERTGASNQKHGNDPDLILRGKNPPLCFVVTKDKGQHPMMIHLRMEDFLGLMAVGIPRGIGVAVQVKARAKTWIGGLLQGLEEAVRDWQGAGL